VDDLEWRWDPAVFKASIPKRLFDTRILAGDTPVIGILVFLLLPVSFIFGLGLIPLGIVQ
jgi:hypothetical protein